MQIENVTEVLGGPKYLPHKIVNRMDLIELSNKGVSKDNLLSLAKYLNLPMRQMVGLLSITERTIQRYTPKKHFNRVVSEQILQIAEVATRGANVFGDKDKFLSWMKQPNKAFDGKIPINLLSSRFGSEMILEQLGRIEHGVFS